MSAAPGHASMADVARRAGVSVATVSRALRSSPLVSAETTARVVEAADELSFAISRAASGLASGRLGRIGLLLGGTLQEWFNASILEAAWTRLAEADTELIVFRVQSTAERERFFTRLPARRNVDALLVASFELTPAERRSLLALGVPVVYVNQRVRGVASVAIDDLAGAKDGARALLGLGHRRVAFVRRATKEGFRYSATRRVDGFRAALDEAGITDQLVVTVPDSSSGAVAVDAVEAQPDRPTALAVDSDELAFSVLSAMGRRGLRAPDHLSVLGFDDHTLAERLGLSTVAQPALRTGAEAAGMALALAAGTSPERRNVVIPTSVVLRQTTGPAR